MSESASVEVLTAEVRVLQIGNGQLTRCMYRQLDEAAPERFEPFGRVKDKKGIPKEWGQPKKGALQLVGRDTKTLVRYDAYPPSWAPGEGPSEFAHWVLHDGRFRPYRPYPVAEGPDGRRVFWTGTADADCPGPSGWHVSKDRPDLSDWIRWEPSSYSQRLEEKKETRIGQVLQRIVNAFSYSPPLEADKETRTQEGFWYSQWLEENMAKRCTVDLIELGQACHAKAEAELAELLEVQAKYDAFKALPLIVLPD